jgi:hypothetical protein
VSGSGKHSNLSGECSSRSGGKERHSAALKLQVAYAAAKSIRNSSIRFPDLSYAASQRASSRGLPRCRTASRKDAQRLDPRKARGGFHQRIRPRAGIASAEAELDAAPP